MMVDSVFRDQSVNITRRVSTCLLRQSGFMLIDFVQTTSMRVQMNSENSITPDVNEYSVLRIL